MLFRSTDFPKFLAAMCSGTVIYDPACKVVGAGSGQPKSKARNQFRIAVKRLEVLYDSIVAEDL